MNYLFPETKQQNKKTLIVIGNGFDLVSGIESSYRILKNGYKRTVSIAL